MSRKLLPLLLVILVSTGCYDWASLVVRQASFDHQCPEERVSVVRDDRHGMTRAVVLDVCGRQRMYRDVGESQTEPVYMWQDVTDVNGGGRRPGSQRR